MSAFFPTYPGSRDLKTNAGYCIDLFKGSVISEWRTERASHEICERVDDLNSWRRKVF